MAIFGICVAGYIGRGAGNPWHNSFWNVISPFPNRSFEMAWHVPIPQTRDVVFDRWITLEDPITEELQLMCGPICCAIDDCPWSFT